MGFTRSVAASGKEVVHMRVVIPPGQRISAVSSYVSLSRTEACELRDALDLVMAAGTSPCHVRVSWGDYETDVTLTLDLTDEPPKPRRKPRP